MSNPEQPYGSKIVFISWLDSLVGSGWIHDENIPLADINAPLVKSVGFLYKETDDSYFLVSNKITHEDNRQVNGYISIPKCSVVEMFYLNRGESIVE